MDYLRGDIVWVKDHSKKGDKRGSVQKGRRPAIIIQNDVGNHHSSTLIVMYGTSVIKKMDQKTHVTIRDYGLEKPTIFMAEQIDTISKGMIGSPIGHLPVDKMDEINYALGISLDIGISNIELEINMYNELKSVLSPNELVTYIKTSILRFSGKFVQHQNIELLSFYQKELERLN